jgi:hypothetical protein
MVAMKNETYRPQYEKGSAPVIGTNRYPQPLLVREGQEDT